MLGHIRSLFRSKILPSSQASLFQKDQSTFWMLFLDFSPSMKDADYPPCRRDAAVQAACAFIRSRKIGHANDLVSISVFGGETNNLVSPSVLSSVCPDSVATLLESSPYISSTRIGKAFLAAKKEVNVFKPRVCRILLLTDGHSYDDPVPHAKALKNLGATIEIVGIGGEPTDVNEKVLRQCASVEDGKVLYRFIGDERGLVEHFFAIAIEDDEWSQNKEESSYGLV